MAIRSVLVVLFCSSSFINAVYVIEAEGDGRGPRPYFETIQSAVNYQGPDSIGNESVVLYHLYTRNNRNDRQTMLLGDVQSVLKSNFNPNWPVKMFAGGYCYYCDMGITIGEYLDRGDYNLIMIDWQWMAPADNFVFQAIRIAGHHSAAFIDFLMEITGVPLSSFHVNGISAGAHVAGAVGQSFRERHNNNQLIPRITGLDPANFVPDLSVINDRIDPTDGAFVDIIHTDDGNAGIPIKMGHADFFPNGGNHQTGCNDPDFECCNHCRSGWLYHESINTPVGFVAYRCDSYEAYKNGECFSNDKQLMGEFVDLNANGYYFLDTNGALPYAMG